jgi:hypothetical protein
VDLVLAYFEAIYWRGVAAGKLQRRSNSGATLRQRCYWARKNARGNPPRDQYAAANASKQVSALEVALGELGLSSAYCPAIREKVMVGRTDVHALARTLRAKQRALHITSA